jgi:hypothetical protein
VEVGTELNDNNFGIICLTPENLTAPWILFEAGAISKSYSQGAVCPYLYDVELSAITGPLQQFQGKKADRPSTKELVESINSKSITPVDTVRLNTIFETFWPSLEIQLSSIPTQSLGLQKPRPQSEILEDLVKSVRAMEGNLRELSDRMTPLRDKSHDKASGILRTTSEIGAGSEDLPAIRFIITADNESVGSLLADEQITFQSSPAKLISAVATRLGLDPKEYLTGWTLRDVSTDQILSRSLIAGLDRYYRGQVCTLKIENILDLEPPHDNDIPF